MMKYWKIIKQQKHPLRFIASRVLIKLRLSSLFAIEQAGFRLKFYPTALSATLWVDPDDRHDDEIFFKRFLRPGNSVIDVGANIGNTALAAAALVGDGGRVIAIEPHPKIYRYLRKNIELNNFKNIVSFNIAMGEKEGVAYISDRKRTDDQNSLAGDKVGLPIDIKRLDDVSTDLAGVDLLKIDVEGYEKYVLLGAEKILQRTECVYYESWESHFNKYGYSTADISELLMKHGFHLYKFMGPGCLSSIGPDYVSMECENLLAVRHSEGFFQRTNLREVANQP